MKSSREEWDARLKDLIEQGRYELTNTNPVEETPTKSNKELKREYKNLVKRLTEQNKHLLDNIGERGFNSYHIDHKISIHYGYNNNISPESIAHHSNLRVITMEENLIKGATIVIDSTNEWVIKKSTYLKNS